MTDPSNTRLLLDIEDLRAIRTRHEQALATAKRNVTIGGLMVIGGFVLFWVSSWYLLAGLLFVLGVVMYLGGAASRRSTQRLINETDTGLAKLKAQVK